VLPGRVPLRAAKVVEDVAERAQFHGEVRKGDGALDQVGAELAASTDCAGAADSVDLAQEEGDEPETDQAPAALGDQKRGVGKEGGGPVARECERGHPRFLGGGIWVAPRPPFRRLLVRVATEALVEARSRRGIGTVAMSSCMVTAARPIIGYTVTVS